MSLIETRWPNDLIWQRPVEIFKHPFHRLAYNVTDNGFYRDADDESIKVKSLDELFANGEFTSLL
jgi:hypothetical protein